MQKQVIDTVAEDGQPSTSTVAAYVDKVYGYSFDFRWPSLAIALGFVIVLRILVYGAAVWRHGR